jgi:signal transduction histidine kinase
MSSTLSDIKEKCEPVRKIADANPGDLSKTMALGRKLVLRKKGEEILSQDQISLNAVINTAATLSHEINNPLMAITGAVEIILKNKDELASDILEKIEQIGISAERIRQVLEKLIDADALYYRDAPGGKVINLDRILNPALSEIGKADR